MKKFNYRKWLTENKYGQANINYKPLNEQLSAASPDFLSSECFVCQTQSAAGVLDPQDWMLVGTSVNFTFDVVTPDPGGMGLGGPVSADGPYCMGTSWNGLNTVGSLELEDLFTYPEPETLNTIYANTGCQVSASAFLGMDFTGSEATGSSTYYGCSVCPEGAVNDLAGTDGGGLGSIDLSGEPNCFPVISFDIPNSEITNNNSSDTDYYWLTINNEYIGSDPEILAYDYLKANDSIACSGSGEVESGGNNEENYQPFCCDINAMNFGQMANGESYGMNPGEPEQYLMQNGPQGDMCDNSICQGNVNEPAEPEGQAIPKHIATLYKDKVKKQRKSRLPRNRKEKLKEAKELLKKIKEQLTKPVNVGACSFLDQVSEDMAAEFCARCNGSSLAPNTVFHGQNTLPMDIYSNSTNKMLTKTFGTFPPGGFSQFINADGTVTMPSSQSDTGEYIPSQTTSMPLYLTQEMCTCCEKTDPNLPKRGTSGSVRSRLPRNIKRR